ncbi:PTS-dependent dihydroxyacetone kinase, ADP-binding subunit DhaL [compost metagenome]
MARAAIEGMKKRGQSDLGDKTLLDAFVPAVDEFERLVTAGSRIAEALRAASVVAREKSEEIKPWVAKRGRAAYTGERSCNTYDAGSIAIAMMAEQLAAVWKSSSTVGAP